MGAEGNPGRRNSSERPPEFLIPHASLPSVWQLVKIIIIFLNPRFGLRISSHISTISQLCDPDTLESTSECFPL